MGAARGRPKRKTPGAGRSGEGGNLRAVEGLERRIAALLAEAARLRRALRALARRAEGG